MNGSERLKRCLELARISITVCLAFGSWSWDITGASPCKLLRIRYTLPGNEPSAKEVTGRSTVVPICSTG